jgi:hypothetical protein
MAYRRGDAGLWLAKFCPATGEFGLADTFTIPVDRPFPQRRMNGTQFWLTVSLPLLNLLVLCPGVSCRSGMLTMSVQQTTGTEASVTFKRHRDADARMESARKLVKLLIGATDLLPSHRKEFIRLALWKVSEAEGGKYSTRYRSLRSIEPRARLQHEHPCERAKLAEALMANPDRADDLLNLAVGCVVTEDEAALLNELSRRRPGLQGWERYREAGITVIDTETGQPLDFRSRT